MLNARELRALAEAGETARIRRQERNTKEEPMNKRYALCPEEREKPCPHEHGQWTGEVPCTGRYVCRMCGLELPYKRMMNEKHLEVSSYPR